MNDMKEWGTFKDSLRAPVHRWFTYPAGFSFKAVEASIASHGIRAGQTIYDPFMGSATTNLVAKSNAINSYGVEAHPFVYRIAVAKMNWDVKRKDVESALQKITSEAFSGRTHRNGQLSTYPELIHKCYPESTLYDLHNLREAILTVKTTAKTRELLRVALVAVLRTVSSAATGWPYIAPKKLKTTSSSKDPIQEYSRAVMSMISDLEVIASNARPGYQECSHTLINGDSRSTAGKISDREIDHIFTSPPYLNNFDYADRTRLEMYFFGDARTWGDISSSVRTKLITSATTQINRSDKRYLLDAELAAVAPKPHAELVEIIDQAPKAGKRVTTC